MEHIWSHNEPANLDELVIFLLLSLIMLDFIIIFRDFYSSFCQVSQTLLHVLLHVSGVWAETNCSPPDDAAKELCIDRTASHQLPQNMEMVTDTLAQNSTRCHNKNLAEEKLTIGEVTMVMRKLGTCYDPDGDKLQDNLGSNEITALFEEQEPSLQEVKEAFSIFDENGDGFINANELKRVLGILCCYSEASEADCRRMIKSFDRNGDGVIDFDEFIRLVANSF